MKLSKIIFLLAVLVTVSISCRPEDALQKDISGRWEGAFGFGNDIPTFYEKWELEKNGEMNSYDPFGGLYATGTWELEGDEFEAQYSPVGETYSYTFSGFYDDDLDEITGTWGETPSAIDGGTFAMYKQE